MAELMSIHAVSPVLIFDVSLICTGPETGCRADAVPAAIANQIRNANNAHPRREGEKIDMLVFLRALV